MPDGLLNIITNNINVLSRLPEPSSVTLCNEYKYRLCPTTSLIVAAAGTTELIDHICRIFANKKTVILQPTYADYEKYATMHNHDLSFITSSWEQSFKQPISSHTDKISSADLVFICNPNNPTGSLLDKEIIISTATKCKNTLFVIDESYMPFTDESQSLINCSLPNLMILRSFSKIYGIPGLRLGFLINHNLKLTNQLKGEISEWSVNTIAQEVALFLLQNTPDNKALNLEEIKQKTIERISKIENISIMDSQTNFFLIKTKKPAEIICQELLKYKILIRNCSNFRGIGDNVIRISIKDKTSMDYFCTQFEEIMESVK